MSDKNRHYAFSWDFVGDVEAGRPNLGNTTRIEMYRLFMYTLRDVLERQYGTEEADKRLYEAGELAGAEFCRRFTDTTLPLSQYLAQLQEVLLQYKVGILRLEESTELENGQVRFMLSVSEDADCSGLPDMDHSVCTYDEGFISGILSTYTGKTFLAKEVDCWCTGDRTCRFEVLSQS